LATRPSAFIVEIARDTGNGPVPSGRTRLRLVFRLGAGKHRTVDLVPSDSDLCVIGRDLECDEAAPRQTLAAAATLAWEPSTRRFTIRTSILGLPPVYLYRGDGRTILTSDLALLAAWPGVELTFDREGVRQFCRIGYPVGYRTLFAGVEVVPGGLQVAIDEHGGLGVQRVWRMPSPQPLARWEELTELQAALFRRAVRRIEGHEAFLSLTGGLDTRAILAALLEAGRVLPALTMGWKDLSLDAVLASALCRAYGIPHDVVAFDESFAAEIADHALMAAQLTGGLAGLDQATEVAFYRRIGPTWQTRVSGCLGNQVGRRGLEQLSLRHGDLALLGEAWSAPQAGTDDGPTLASDAADASDPHVAAFHRALFASVANYGVGQHFMEQVSPYATRSLIESLAHAPSEAHVLGDSTLGVRLRDLRHRFVGEPMHRSFQRQVIAGLGGRVAAQPINWGWRASGGLSLPGVVYGLLAAVDAAAVSRTRLAAVGRAVARLPGIVGRHTFRQPRRWWSRDRLQSLLLDRDTRHSGLFHVPTLRRRIEEHYSGRRDHLHDLAARWRRPRSADPASHPARRRVSARPRREVHDRHPGDGQGQHRRGAPAGHAGRPDLLDPGHPCGAAVGGRDGGPLAPARGRRCPGLAAGRRLTSWRPARSGGASSSSPSVRSSSAW
jgi:hypothetical protein